jgi:hypothetical protein
VLATDNIAKHKGRLRGHEDQFQPPRQNGRWWSGEATLAGTGSKEDEAPKSTIVVAWSRLGPSSEETKTQLWPC